MARSRNIKPAFFMNEDLAENNDALGRILFIGLWTIADYKGDLEWRPGRIKAQLLPYDNCDIKQLAINLDKSGFVRFYSDGNKIYLNITNFVKHQNPHKNERESGSEIPAYTDAMRQVIDLKELTINRDKSGLIRNQDGTNPADSLIPITESLLPTIGHSDESPELKEDFLTELFDKFWSNYPIKQKKANAEKSFRNLMRGKSKRKAEMETYALLTYYHDHLVGVEFGADKLHPTSYLNQRRWKDDPAFMENFEKQWEQENE